MTGSLGHDNSALMVTIRSAQGGRAFIEVTRGEQQHAAE